MIEATYKVRAADVEIFLTKDQIIELAVQAGVLEPSRFTPKEDAVEHFRGCGWETQACILERRTENTDTREQILNKLWESKVDLICERLAYYWCMKPNTWV